MYSETVAEHSGTMRSVQRFQGGLVSKAHRLWCHCRWISRGRRAQPSPGGAREIHFERLAKGTTIIDFTKIPGTKIIDFTNMT
jgi:hypothetical protein